MNNTNVEYDKLLNKYNRQDKRLNKIIKQSDNQQKRVLELNEELDEYKTHLEKKVFEKTKELHTLNKNLEKKIKEAVDANRKKDQQLNEQAKFAQIGELIKNIAHHWRQPLNVISTIAGGIVTMKELDLVDKDEELEGIKTIIETTQDLSTVIKDFQNHINEDINNSHLILQEQLNKTINIIKSTLSDNKIEIITRFPENEIKLFSINSKISQVVLNIIKNAQDALLKTKKDINKHIIISIINQDHKVFISIEDNADGIPADILPKIFDPYFTTKHQSKGTGLGLYSAREDVEKYLNGIIVSKNTKNGAIFIIDIAKDLSK